MLVVWHTATPVAHRFYSCTAGHLHRLNNKITVQTKYGRLTQTFSKQEVLIVLFIFTNCREQRLRSATMH
jgi:hypothetical protein